jgi:hypothetical protein
MISGMIRNHYKILKIKTFSESSVVAELAYCYMLTFHVVPCGPKIGNKLIVLLLLLLLLLLLYLYANCTINIQPGTRKRLLIVITENLLELSGW